MAGEEEWIVVFFVEESGACPVEEFLDSLDAKTQGRFLWSIEQLRQRNVMARPPLVEHLEGKLWELREQSNTNIYRLIYFFYTGRHIVFLHGFQKKTEKTPRREIETAKARLDRFIKRQEESEK
jgi:phage-related protein